MAASQKIKVHAQENESPEYRTIRMNTVSLIDLLGYSIKSIGNVLSQEGLIPDDLYHTIQESTHEQSRQVTTDVMSCLTDQIMISPSAYHKFISILKKEGQLTESMIELMTNCYEEFTPKQVSMDITSSDESATSELEQSLLESEEFQYLDVSGLNENEKVVLEQKLKSETKNMLTRFSDFTVAIRDSLESQIPLNKLKHSILNLNAFTDGTGISAKVLDPQDAQKIEHAKSIAKVFNALRTYISFLNYEIIEWLIKHYGTDDDKTKLQEYCSELKKFCQKSVYEIPSKTYSNPRPEANEFVIKCTSECVKTLQDVRDVKVKVADVLSLRYTALQLHTIEKGCVELHFFIPTAAADHLFPITSKQHSDFKEIGVRVVSQQFCSVMPLAVPPVHRGSDNVQDIPYASGSIRTSQLWDMKNFRDRLKVHFMNPHVLVQENWKCGQSPLTTNIILSWAQYWNAHPTNAHKTYYPQVDDIHATRNEAQIRVFFTSKFVLSSEYMIV